MSMKYDWYQCDKFITITIIYKNASEKLCTVIIRPEGIEVAVEDSRLSLELLNLINAEHSFFDVMPNKIIIKLMKTQSDRWNQLTKTVVTAPKTVTKKKPEDWDRLAKEIVQTEEKEREGEEALQALFKKIYADSNDDTRKAMVKSFTESGGTVLSTNWSEVGSKEVEVRPPDGCEFKKN